ncbi:alpha/beta hydrolase [Phyllobacterium endophyticum]|uniref:Esterase n=1 Tax=Phyllobacterium endophyticum TaxID=1149773 RepID=A0A2P7AKY9_9HYPH|nr:alpha/beta hydrolase [Phyllobacterium endophyticum]MBB3233243.1 phospholipase/carboxylesterase [Phyllobacterium endophyticum]PSH54868.1 esterase [Phyllobacterium endophyticum]TYR43263.1 alpha/beta hydrolase [Phyllobacterium endophyticum]
MPINSYKLRSHPAEMPGNPLLFVFHGTGGDENQFFDFGRQLLPEAGIVSPRGDVFEHGAARFFRRTQEGVYDMEDLARRTSAMADFIRAHKDKAKPSRTIGLGYSNGANILASIMLSHPELFDESVLMHPLVPWTPAPQLGLAGRRALITAGRLDTICPPVLTQTFADYLVEQGVETDLVWHSGGHEIQQSEVAAIERFVRAKA